MSHVLAIVGGILGRIEKRCWQFPAALINLFDVVTKALGTDDRQHPRDRLHCEKLAPGSVHIELDIARANCDGAIENHWFPGALTVLAVDGIDKTGLGEVLRNI